MAKIRLSRTALYRIIIFTVCVLTLFCMDYLKIGESGFKEFSGGAGMPDMQFGNTPEQIYTIIGKLNSEGRLFYLRFIIVDFIFITSFALAQAEILKLIMGKILLSSKWRYLISLSYIRGFLDAVENILMIVMLTQLPVEMSGLARLAVISTSLKFIVLGLWVTAALMLFAARKLLVKSPSVRLP